MKLDPQTAPIGTRGYLPPSGAMDFDRAEGFDWFKDESQQVELSAAREWVSVTPDPLDHTFETPPDAVVEKHVFSDWKEAIRFTLNHQRTEELEWIDEAVKTLKHIAAVEGWLDEQ